MAGDKKRWDFLTTQIKENDYSIGAEIGVQAGKTFKRIVESCPNITLYGIDVWVADKQVRLDNQPLEGKEYHKNYDKLNKWINDKKLDGRAIMIRSYSDQCLDQFKDESIDFIFIDADHSYEGVRRDTLNWSKKVRAGGLVAGHDSGYDEIAKWLNEIRDNESLQDEVGMDRKILLANDNVWWYRKR